MRICFFGAGSLGSALGGILSEKNDVTLIGRRAHVMKVLKRGLRLTGDIRRIARLKASESIKDVEPPELLVISTKAYDTPEAVAICKDWAAKDTLVLTLQNGVGNLKALRTWKGEKAFGGTTTLGATLTSPGTVRISGLGRTVIGADLDPSHAQSIASMFSVSGIPALVTKDTFGEIWSKAVVSACINSTTAVLRIPNGRLLESRMVMRFLDAVCIECVSIARECDIRLDARALQLRVRSVVRDTARNRSSMLQDLELGRRTEIAQINGAFCGLADRYRIPLPFNRSLTSMVESLEAQTGRQKG